MVNKVVLFNNNNNNNTIKIYKYLMESLLTYS